MTELDSHHEHGAEAEALYVGFLETDVDEPMRLASMIPTASIRQVVESFCINIRSVAFMVATPYTLLLHEQTALEHVVLSVRAKLKTPKPFVPFEQLTPRERRAVHDKMVEIAAQERKDKNREQRTRAAIDNEFRHLLGFSEEIRSGYRALLYSGIVWIWASFEVFCSDLWEAAVNESPHLLAKYAISGLSRLDRRKDTDATIDKHIRLDYLAKYGYDLTHNMGTILKSRFDFTSMSGIRQAYRAAFPKSKNIGDLLDKSDLLILERKRHLIVHRAGRVDESFVRKTSIDLPIGSPMPVSDKEVVEYVNLVINVGLSLIDSVYAYLDEPVRAILIRRLAGVLRFASEYVEDERQDTNTVA